MVSGSVRFELVKVNEFFLEVDSVSPSVADEKAVQGFVCWE